MKQYIDWVDPDLTVTDFYSNDTVKVGALGASAKCMAQRVPHAGKLSSL